MALKGPRSSPCDELDRNLVLMTGGESSSRHKSASCNLKGLVNVGDVHWPIADFTIFCAHIISIFSFKTP